MKVKVVLNGMDVKEIEVENGDPQVVANTIREVLGARTVLRGSERLGEGEGQEPVAEGEEVYASTPTKPNGF
jgi:ribosomal protein S3